MKTVWEGRDSQRQGWTQHLTVSLGRWSWSRGVPLCQAMVYSEAPCSPPPPKPVLSSCTQGYGT